MLPEIKADDLAQAMKELRETALGVKAERDRMREALENILALTTHPTLKVIHEEARRGLGEL